MPGALQLLNNHISLRVCNSFLETILQQCFLNCSEYIPCCLDSLPCLFCAPVYIELMFSKMIFDFQSTKKFNSSPLNVFNSTENIIQKKVCLLHLQPCCWNKIWHLSSWFLSSYDGIKKSTSVPLYFQITKINLPGTVLSRIVFSFWRCYKLFGLCTKSCYWSSLAEVFLKYFPFNIHCTLVNKKDYTSACKWVISGTPHNFLRRRCLLLCSKGQTGTQRKTGST